MSTSQIIPDRFPTRLTKVDTDMLKSGLRNLPSALKQMGFPSLRKGQDTVVYHLLGCSDVICILPTSLGKTACFVVPTLCHNWKTIVISPLVALIRDQMKGLWDKGIAAGELSSLSTKSQNVMTLKDWANGDLNFLYIAPERIMNEEFIQACQKTPPDFVVIDEAHSISSWSDNFRPAYKIAGDFVNKFNPKVVAAFTATCPEPVEQDIRWVMGLKSAEKIVYYPRRTNLKLTSRPLRSNHDLIQDIRRVPGSTLIYCTAIKKVEEIAAELSKFVSEPIGYFHGQLSPSVKKHQQDSFMNGDIRVMLATSAFGMGIDKALPLSSKILTPNGWVSNEAIQPGDLVIGGNGLPTKVIAIHDVGVVDSYRVKFDDGTSTVCGADHVWSVRTPKEKYRGKEFSQKTTLELLPRLTDSSNNYLWFIPIVAPVDYRVNFQLPVPPYLLGALLGDGGLRSNCIRFHKDDQHILDRMNSLLSKEIKIVKYDSCQYGLVCGKGKKNTLLDSFRKLELAGTNAENKFIPEMYLNSNLEDRLALLQGLMDTDGGVSGGGGIGAIFCTASKKLRDGVIYLARSLGGTPTWRKLSNGDYWQVYLMLPNSINPFSLPRKANKLMKRIKYEPTRCIVSIDKEPPQAMKCITVEADDGLFVTEEFVVTHNCDIRHVIERDISSSIEATTQQLGRASRDGGDAICCTYYSDDSVRTQEFFLRNSYPTKADIVDVYNAIRSTADSTGKTFAKKSQFASLAGVSNFQIDSIVSNLISENVVRRSKDKDALTKLKVLIHPDGTDDKYDLWMAHAEECGELGADNTLYLDLNEYSEKLGFSSSTTPKKWLTQWAKEKRIHVEFPLRTGPLEVIGSTNQIDFARLARRREEAYKKLQEVIDYTSVPDDEKHAYLEEKLGITSNN